VTVLVGWSSSEEGAAALESAVAEATLRGGSLAVLDLTAADDRGQATRRVVGEVAGRHGGLTVRAVERPEKQDPVDALLDAAVAEQAELVVVGTRRRSPVGKFLLGSTAQRVILGAEVPVLVVKPGREG
jgi:nucleotide-binding universal stress UspA family protein